MSIQRAVVLAVAVLAAIGLQAQVALGTIQIKTCSSTMPGYVIYIDISGGQFTPHVTPPESRCPDPPAVLPQTAVEFADSYGTFFTTTANSGLTGPPLPSCAKPNGLVISNGVVVSPLVPNGPAMTFAPTNTQAAIAELTSIPTGTQNAVAGTTTVGYDCLGGLQGGLLVENGNPGPCILPKSLSIAPRTAAGVNADGTILIIATVGGVEGISGLITFDMANLMISLGAQNAVNFDGGGSSAFLWLPGNNPPPKSQALVNMMEASHFPDGFPNPEGLTFTVTNVSDYTQNLCYCAQNPNACCGGVGCRQVYANLGFTYKPSPRRP